MIKLIATDIDGTLLAEGKDQLNPELFDVILKLRERGIYFAAASGRHYSSMKNLFAPAAHEMIFICDNGAYIMYKGQEMSASELNRNDTVDLIQYIRALPDCDFTVSSKERLYVEECHSDCMQLLFEGYHSDVCVVPDVLEEDIKIIKVALFKASGVNDIIEDVKEKWQDKFRTMVAGEPWIDFIDHEADKGNALNMLQNILDISKDETMAFGDNYNDLGMMEAAGESYAVANARTAVRKAARHLAEKNINDGVLKVLKQVLENLES